MWYCIFAAIVIVYILSYFLYKKIKQNKELTLENTELKETLAPIKEVGALLDEAYAHLDSQNDRLEQLRQEYSEKYKIYNDLKSNLRIFSEEAEIMEAGLYKPIYDYQTSEKYKQKLDENYKLQKTMIAEDEAVECETDWILQGSKAEGLKMIKKEKNLMLKAFNCQCDREIEKVRWNNWKNISLRINKIFEEVNKIGKFHDLEITEEFLELKQAQLNITYEYRRKLQDEKEEQARLREQMREEEKIRKEAEQAQKRVDEMERREAELKLLREEAYNKGLSDAAQDFEVKFEELQKEIEEGKRTVSNAQLTKKGHIYIISNIGSFGEDVYKIGMTRRSTPEERVDELGDASVPFKFDIHAMIHSENAPELENKLHQIFRERSVNRVNYRKEFFRVSLDEIEKAVNEIREGDNEEKIEFLKTALAEEYRETQAIIASEKGIALQTQIKQEEELLPQEI